MYNTISFVKVTLIDLFCHYECYKKFGILEQRKEMGNDGKDIHEVQKAGADPENSERGVWDT